MCRVYAGSWPTDQAWAKRPFVYVVSDLFLLPLPSDLAVIFIVLGAPVTFREELNGAAIVISEPLGARGAPPLVSSLDSFRHD